ncbi:MAG: phosphorylase [Hormoscilla sp. GM102CHS1]|nr:phosphorylase [Hormoscilla sp. GM102CHS1]
MSESKPIIRDTLMLQPGTLWQKITERTAHALACGALQPIPTECEFVEDSGIRFLLRILSNLARKDAAKKHQDKKTKEFNPFLPYEEDLFVADISETHLCLLNKYNVVDSHILIVTRSFEEQETWLTEPDFQAMWACMAEFEGLAFYNGGKIAGASQRHKHLQIVPLPLNNKPQTPIDEAIASATFDDTVGRTRSFPFRHAIARFDPDLVKSPQEAGKIIWDCYHNLLAAVGLEVTGNRQSGAYNFLATREWMLVVPRSGEDFQSISVNSLGFAGALLVRNQQQMQILKDSGPMTVLSTVAQPQ